MRQSDIQLVVIEIMAIDELINTCIPCFEIYTVAREMELSDKSLVWFETPM